MSATHVVDQGPRIPPDLFKSLVKAGKQARDRGQHHLARGPYPVLCLSRPALASNVVRLPVPIAPVRARVLTSSDIDQSRSRAQTSMGYSASIPSGRVSLSSGTLAVPSALVGTTKAIPVALGGTRTSLAVGTQSSGERIQTAPAILNPVVASSQSNRLAPRWSMSAALAGTTSLAGATQSVGERIQTAPARLSPVAASNTRTTLAPGSACRTISALRSMPVNEREFRTRARTTSLAYTR
mmetsp:Transcript_37227/g.58946  ORF Transcript_37227/g.58946 Transcript_37227/m.58946 type:complete len:240 (+) Transcript_37227:62-781(+)